MLKTLSEVLQLAAQYLKDRHDQCPRLHAELLLSHVLKVPRLDLYLQFDRPLEESELASYRALIKKKAGGEPVEYLCGEVVFADCQLLVNSAVLIPRPETEILLDKVFHWFKKEGVLPANAWDLCCGAGGLGLGLKKKIPGLTVTLSDLSPAALEVALANAKRNGLEVEFLQGDLLAPFAGRKADWVLCNPPYISLGEWETLDSSVKDFEPKGALCGGGDGLEFFRRCSQELPGYLNRGAKVVFEIGATQGKAVQELFQAGCWKKREVEKDWAGHDRFFFLEFE